MLLVLLHHAGVPFGRVILAFHMPLFFILSGYTAHMRKKGQPRAFVGYIQQKFKRLIVPYFCFELLNLVLYLFGAVVRGWEFSPIISIISIISCVNLEGYIGICGRLWFLPCMFIADIYVYFFEKATFKLNQKKQRILAVVIIIVLFILSWISCRFLPFRLPFTFDTALMAAAYILLGKTCGEGIDWIVKNKKILWDIVLFSSSSVILCFVITQDNTYMHMYLNEYGHYPLTLLGSLTGSVAFFLVGKYLYRIGQKITWFMSFVLWYSYHSLEVFPIHLELIWIMSFLLSKVGLDFWLLIFVVVLIGCIPIGNFITRYLPFVLGQSKK